MYNILIALNLCSIHLPFRPYTFLLLLGWMLARIVNLRREMTLTERITVDNNLKFRI